MNKSLIITILVAVLVGGAGFFGGMKYQQIKRQTQLQQFGGVQGARTGQGTRGNGNSTGFRPVVGEIISSDDKSITVKMSDGSSKIVMLNDNTVVNKTSAASKGDLKTGEQVQVFGTTNSDGSVSAQNIQLNPILRSPTTPNGS